MRFNRPLIVVTIFLPLIVVAWILITSPSTVDLSSYAPADSLLYLECNDVQTAVSAIQHTSTWQKLQTHLKNESATSEWALKLARWTGVGPAEMVVAARAQAAVVVTDISTITEDETLRIRPEFALIVETHTPAIRTTPVVEQLLSDFARRTYGAPVFKKEVKDDTELMSWKAPDSDRRIVTSIQGTVVTVANSDAALQKCLEVRRGSSRSLKETQELHNMRNKLAADKAMAFGYVPADKISQVATIAVPLLTQDETLTSLSKELLPKLTGKVIGSIGWSASADGGLVEDRYHVALAPGIQTRLRAALKPTKSQSQVLQQLASKADSVTLYCYENPLAAWRGIESAFLSPLDALSAVVFQTFLKSTLLTYRIDEPEKFLGLLGREIYTVRVSPESERSVLVAEVRDTSILDELMKSISLTDTTAGDLGSGQILTLRQKQLAVVLKEKYILMGAPDDVPVCLDLISQSALERSNTEGASQADLPLAVTISRDDQRVEAFVRAVAHFRDGQSQLNDSTINNINKGAKSITTTYLAEDGIERRTRCPIGQIGALVALVAAQ